MNKLTPYDKQGISVDCVILAFDGESLKVLLTKRRDSQNGHNTVGDFKLPGSLVLHNETLEVAVERVLDKHLGVKQIYMRQLEVFSNPQRISKDEVNWLNRYYSCDLERVITVAYYSLVKLDKHLINTTLDRQGKWVNLDDIRSLALDHNSILIKALSVITSQLQNEPIAFELLPKEFTIRQLRALYEAVLGIELDPRNFRKKILSSPYVVATNKKESGVAHKPAVFYRFDKKLYHYETKQLTKANFLNWNI